MENLQTFDDLVGQANKMQLYTKLVEQLNKDLSLANVNLEFDPAVLPTSLKLLLHEKVYHLIQEKFMDYLNLLYIVDVSEEKIRALDGNDALQLSENVTFLLLKREWQKVYYRSTFPS
ncbi:hypothetical protein LX77_01350 [Gelidibacter algens]|jgi:hypothetical protein|uniref:Uncharacterized protein n=1 Tax=Gelidibacter algens TaxID=49280 RepID=A0A1A7R4H7_9FLAO|nr:hypothetical protein [Gelidibacter algens]OBX26413.1 hypothetical protein A9996_05105 [Gelidibacter algens]RAJ25932.1 hypothetical protein LX77_01350 [Gelidibacter algens]